MTLREKTREVIHLVEEKTGFPVQVSQEPNLGTIAAVRVARGNIPFHAVVYKPFTGEPPDYVIVQECVFVIRKFSIPQEERFDIASTEKGQQEIDQLLQAPGGAAFKYGLKGPAVSQLRNQLLGGLITHLLSVPLSFRASAWIANHYPEFMDLQRKHVERELATSKETLEPKIKEMFPSKVFKATQAINAAHALYWSQKYDNTRIFAPYRFEYRKTAEELLQIYNRVHEDPAHDQELVDTWGKALGLTDWYVWVPYQLPRPQL